MAGFDPVPDVRRDHVAAAVASPVTACSEGLAKLGAMAKVLIVETTT